MQTHSWEETKTFIVAEVEYLRILQGNTLDTNKLNKENANGIFMYIVFCIYLCLTYIEFIY